MQLVQIPKRKKGEFRTIAVPSPELKTILRFELDELNDKATKLCAPNVHGFMRGRSPVTNAKQHVGYAYTLSFDLSDFFDTVKASHLKGKMSDELIEKVMPDGRAWQGLPTSPAVANLAAIPIDEAVLKKIKDRPNLVYTRYADDLTFSFNDFGNVAFLKEHVPQIISRCGFKTNKNKTRIQDARFGRRTVTGISVGTQDMAVSRSVKRNLRAAKHQKQDFSARGLEEWSKLKTPQILVRREYNQNDLTQLCALWKIKRVVLKSCPPPEPDIDLGCGVIVTNDVPTKLGISNFVTSWTSCMAHPAGSNHEKVVGWAYHAGTKVAGLMSKDKKKFGEFERSCMKARALVHTLVDGRKVYNRIYGESATAMDFLKSILVENGYKDITTIKNVQMMGEIPKFKMPKGGLYQERFLQREEGTVFKLYTS